LLKKYLLFNSLLIQYVYERVFLSFKLPLQESECKSRNSFSIYQNFFEKILAILKELPSVSEETGLQSYNLLSIKSKFIFKIVQVTKSLKVRDVCFNK